MLAELYMRVTRGLLLHAAHRLFHLINDARADTCVAGRLAWLIAVAHACVCDSVPQCVCMCHDVCVTTCVPQRVCMRECVAAMGCAGLVSVLH